MYIYIYIYINKRLSVYCHIFPYHTFNLKLTAGFLLTPPIELPGGAHGSKPGTEVGRSSAGAVLQAAPGAQKNTMISVEFVLT